MNIRRLLEWLGVMNALALAPRDSALLRSCSENRKGLTQKELAVRRNA